MGAAHQQMTTQRPALGKAQALCALPAVSACPAPTPDGARKPGMLQCRRFCHSQPCDLEPVPSSFLPLWAPIFKMGAMVPLLAPHQAVMRILSIEKHLLNVLLSSGNGAEKYNFLKNLKSLIPTAATPKVGSVKFSKEKMCK